MMRKLFLELEGDITILSSPRISIYSAKLLAYAWEK